MTQHELFGGNTQQTSSNYRKYNSEFSEYVLVDTKKKLNKLAEHLENVDVLAFDTETDTVEAMEANLAGISISTGIGIGWYIPTNTMQLTLYDIRKVLYPIFERDDLLLIAHNYKYDHKVMTRHGFDLGGNLFDTMVAGYLVDHQQKLKMDKLSKKYLGYQPISIDNILTGNKTMFDIPIDEVVIYACEDADITFQLYDFFKQKLKDDGLESLAYEMEFPITRILTNMEMNGIKLNKEFLHGFDAELQEKLDEIQTDLFDMAGKEFNPRSYLQVGEILYDVLGLPVLEKTDSGNRATGEDVLNKLKDRHEFPAKLLTYRSVKKLKGTYVSPLPKKVNASTGRLHTTLKQTRTDTGRLSSADPNLQNIPIREELGRKTRKAFVAEDGYRLINADYSQMELRIIASICQDENMLSIFRNGEDIHSGTAAEIFGKDIDDVEYEERYQAKTINYAIPYGADYPKISRELEISEEKAKSLLRSYFSKFKGMRRYIDQQHKFVKEHGYVKTRYGRRRYLPDIHSSNQWKRFAAQRQAVNMPIQGESADIMKMAMIDVYNWTQQVESDTRLLLQVHDEIIVETPKEVAEENAKKVITLMENAADIGVHLDVDAGISTTWYEGH